MTALWHRIQQEAAHYPETILQSLLHKIIHSSSTLPEALSVLLAEKLASPEVSPETLFKLFKPILALPHIAKASEADLNAVMQRDPAVEEALTPFLFFKGFHALQSQRIAHHLWHEKRKTLALFLQSQASLRFAVDIHPAARMGKGIFIDHGTGVVIGETALVEDDVSILHGVTLGGTGKEHFDRHPKVRSGVLLSAGATILGNIEIGSRAKVAASSVVLKSVAPCTTVAGVPAKVVGICAESNPAEAMNHSFDTRMYSFDPQI